MQQHPGLWQKNSKLKKNPRNWTKVFDYLQWISSITQSKSGQ
jgi:hypothetical protein